MSEHSSHGSQFVGQSRLALDVQSSKCGDWENTRKPHIIDAIHVMNAHDSELIECWDEVRQNKSTPARKIAPRGSN